YWIATVAVFARLILLALPVIVLFLSLYFGLFGFLSRRIKSGSPFHYLYLPCLWVSLELIRSHLFLGGFPWGLLGYSQHLNLPLIQISSFTGIYGVSFLIVLVNVAVANLFLSPGRHRRVVGCWLLITGFLVGGSLFYGRQVLREEIEGESLRVAIVQGNIAQAEKWDWSRREEFLGIHAQLTREASLEEPALIVWPETSAVPGHLPDDRYLFDTLVNLSQESGAYILVGGVHRHQGRDFNSAFLFSPRGIEEIFDKIHLVPFGEFLPGERFIPSSWREALRLGEGFKHGEEFTLFALPQGQFIVPICYEIIFPHLVRRLLGQEADFIVNITNDAWFGKTAGPYQHAAMATFRAVEARRPLVRAANTGISLFIDPFGRREILEVDNQPLFVRGTLTREIVLTGEIT
ncbi:apolipoprotein N-acyltransferase, partial [candidate division NPL-UPA2 bacterium]|nr:apolipoprotein N-acyltransferase [candidate division NPL-UPA2 bacterium]